MSTDKSLSPAKVEAIDQNIRELRFARSVRVGTTEQTFVSRVKNAKMEFKVNATLRGVEISNKADPAAIYFIPMENISQIIYDSSPIRP